MAIIREWVITIISVIIFVTFIEILIPNSNHKRYIDAVVGFLLVIVILTPLTNVISGKINLEEEILKTSNELELYTSQNRINNIKYSNNEAIIELYKSDIVKQIKNHIEGSTQYIVDRITVDVEDNSSSEEFGLIKKLNITLGEKMENVEHTDKSIETIKINVSVDKKNNNTVVANSILINNKDNLIRENISNLYNVPKDDITIYVLKDN